MHIGMIGIGRMGANMRDRLREREIAVTGFDLNPALCDVASIPELIDDLPEGPRLVWVMLPAGEVTHDAVLALGELLREGDIVVDGGNSRYTDDRNRSVLLAERGIGYIDVGVSGGVWGREEGYGLMVGGAKKLVDRLMPVFDALRPSGPREESFVHVGTQAGAGHYAKMIHNGIEYGLMQAYAEGYELLLAEPLIENVAETFTAWQRGTVVRSWLLELLVKALREDENLDAVAGYVDDSGEGRWTIIEALSHAVPAPVMSAALFARFTSRQDDSPSMKAVAALRHEFGGHAVKSTTGLQSPTGPSD